MTAARAAVLRQLAGAHDRFTEQERSAVEGSRFDEAERAHRHALRLLRAFRAESDGTYQDDTHPHVLAIPGCPRCEGVIR